MWKILTSVFLSSPNPVFILDLISWYYQCWSRNWEAENPNRPVEIIHQNPNHEIINHKNHPLEISKPYSLWILITILCTEKCVRIMIKQPQNLSYMVKECGVLLVCILKSNRVQPKMAEHIKDVSYHLKIELAILALLAVPVYYCHHYLIDIFMECGNTPYLMYMMFVYNFT